MTAERHALVKSIFLEAVDLPSEKQAAFITSRCGDDDELKREVGRLLQHHTDETLESTAAPQPAPVAKSGSTEPPDPRLQPGSIIADRYRIISKLGGGGMGVVYQAEDTTLGQTVALKFLDPAMASNRAWLERFRNEVRTAREVTHANVCRIFDIGESEGLHFLSMEYVDGEDLKSLLRRIGRVPREKAIDIARQLCIGLAAAHGAGILHRDLKPANVMLDGRGQVRITDFGLAGTPESIRSGDVRSGTPPYMAPEQIAGREVTVRSDIYALGLVLYEMFSGRQAFEADSVEGFVELHESAYPENLSALVDDVDKEVEQIIEKCLRKAPEDRPASALAVAAALPGVNPLAAALAANETPSPELVAAAPPTHASLISPRWLFALALTLLVGTVLLRGTTLSFGERSFVRQPAVMAEIARQVIRDAGHTAAEKDFAFGYARVPDVEAVIPASYEHRGRDQTLASDAELVFWYRQSPAWLAPSTVENVVFGTGRVRPNDPSIRDSGGIFVALDSQGRLLLFLVEPGANAADAITGEPADYAEKWQKLVDYADLDFDEGVTPPVSEPAPYVGDEAILWQGARKSDSTRFISVEGTAWRGRPVFLAVRSQADKSSLRAFSDDPVRRMLLVDTWFRVLLLVVTVGALPWAWRNHRHGRVDRRGATVLAASVMAMVFLAWLLRARHIPEFNAELLRLCVGLLWALGTAALLVVFYAALEPYARRYWPDLLITWSRAVSGGVADASVGLHVLIGVCTGLFLSIAKASDHAVVHWLGWALRPSLLSERLADKVLGTRLALANFLGAVPDALVSGLLLLLLLAGLRALVRRPVLAGVLAVVVLVPILIPRGPHLGTAWLTMGVGAGVVVWVMARFGLVALATAIFVTSIINTTPMTLDYQSWYADVTVCSVLLVSCLAGAALYVASLRPRGRGAEAA